jgi:hypothetical protein
MKMKRRFALSILILYSVVGMAHAGQSNASAKPPSAFEQTLMNDENSFIEAAKKGDASFLKRTLTDDFSFVQFDGQLYSRQEMIDQFSEPGTNITPYEMKVIPVADDAAIVTYNVVLRVPVSEDQGPPPRYQHFSTTWVKQDGAWKMKFLQMTANHWGDW